MSKIYLLSSDGDSTRECVGNSTEYVAERQRMQEERESTQQCLGICAQVSTHIDQVQPNALENISILPSAYERLRSALGGPLSARLVTVNTSKESKERLIATSSQLERYLLKITNQLPCLSSQPLRPSNEDTAEQNTITRGKRQR